MKYSITEFTIATDNLPLRANSRRNENTCVMFEGEKGNLRTQENLSN
jgi:hypothetical protein